MLNFAEHKKVHNKLSDKLVWFGIVAPGVILNKNGSLQKTCEIMGHDLGTSSVAMIDANCSKLNHIFKQIGSGWALYFDVVRSKTTAYPNSKFPNDASSLLDLERKEMFCGQQNFLESKYYLTLIYLPSQDSDVNVANKFVESSSKVQSIDRARDVAEFQKTTRSIINSLCYPFAMVKELSDKKTLTYLHSIISTKSHEVNVPSPAVYLDCILSDTSLLGGLQPMLGDKYFKVLTIRFLPNESWPGLLDDLNCINVEFRWTSRWVALDKGEARKEINSKVRAWMSKRISFSKLIGKMLNLSADVESDNSEAQLNHDDAHGALFSLDNNSASFGYYTATIIVYDELLSICESKLDKIAALINDKGFVCKIENANAKEAWLGSLPGHCYANMRAPLVSTINLSHFISISSPWGGETQNNHFKKTHNDGSPLMVTQTEGGTPFRLNLHQGDVGHTLVLGPTGKGKSTLLVALALQFLRYENSQVFFFDKGYSAKVASYAVGGAYYQFERKNSDFVLQPLKDIDSADELEWAESWVADLIFLQGVECNVEQRAEIRRALKALASRNEKYRTLLNLKGLMQEKDNQMGLALEKFVTGGPYGYLLDGDKENLSSNNWTTFELERLMEGAKDAVEPVLTCLFHKIEKRFNGKPSLLILDEAWTYLKNETFSAQIGKWLRELRKNEVSVIFASQSLSDAINTPLMSVLLESCQTKILLPNQEANNSEISAMYKKVGLNEAQIDIIANAIPKKEYFYFSGAGVRLFDLSLGEIAIALCCNAGQKASVRADNILKKYGGGKFLNEWLASCGVKWASKIFKGEHK
jgi:type IV secretion system protein TrbE